MGYNSVADIIYFIHFMFTGITHVKITSRRAIVCH